MSAPLKTFIIYARDDEAYKKDLLLHLRPLVVSGLLTVWHDGDIKPGEDWENAIKKELKASELVIVLVSVYSLNSNFIQTEELRTAFDGLDAGLTRVVPVVVSPCVWKFDPVIRRLQALPLSGPKGVLPVSEWNNSHLAWSEVVEQIGDMVVELNKVRELEAPQQPAPITEKKTEKKTEVHPPTFNNQSIPSPARHGKKSGLTMIPIEGGTFTMGSPLNEPDRFSDECQHSVTVGNFAIGQYVITQADWVEVMGSNPSRFENCDECPVENVSWDDAQAFIKAANQKYGRKFRLPTEAEWEYAARGGKQNEGTVYAGSNDPDEVAWYDSNAAGKTHIVGLKKANALGLYDMSGNVWEWCADNYGPYPGCSEPKTKTTKRVLRGGSWSYVDRVCRVTDRFWGTPDNRYYAVGFRVSQD